MSKHLQNDVKDKLDKLYSEIEILKMMSLSHYSEEELDKLRVAVEYCIQYLQYGMKKEGN